MNLTAAIIGATKGLRKLVAVQPCPNEHPSLKMVIALSELHEHVVEGTGGDIRVRGTHRIIMQYTKVVWKR